MVLKLPKRRYFVVELSNAEPFVSNAEPIPTTILPRKHHEFAQVLKTTRIAYKPSQKDTRYGTSLNVETDSRH